MIIDIIILICMFLYLCLGLFINGFFIDYWGGINLAIILFWPVMGFFIVVYGIVFVLFYIITKIIDLGTKCRQNLEKGKEE